MFEGASIQESEVSHMSHREIKEKGKSYIVVKPGEAPSTKRTVIEENTPRHYRCVPVTDYRDLITGKKKG